MNGASSVLVFRTSVVNAIEVERLRPALDRIIADRGRWNFDLEDRDRILRVEARHVVADQVVWLIQEFGHDCAELE